MADKHILLTFISPHNIDRNTNNLKITKDENGEYYNTLGPSVRKVLKEHGRLDYVVVISTEKTAQPIDVIVEGVQENISPFSLFEKFCKKIDSNIKIQKIGIENDYDFKSNVSAVLKAVSFIKSIIPETENVVIHIDTTPGFRNASMLLTAITQLFKLNPKIKIEEALYYEIIKSEVKCHGITDIYEISGLSAGAEAFVEYGNAKVLDKYFANKNIPNLRPLLKAISDFADALSICSTNLLDQKIKNLKVNIDQFEKKAADFNEYEKLFSVFLEKIKEKYNKLFDDSGKSKGMQLLNRIEWCRENNYIQQEVTLATELIPEIIYLEKIFSPINEAAVKTYQKNDNSMKKKERLAKYFMISYKHCKSFFGFDKTRFGNMLKRREAASILTPKEAIDICSTYLKLDDVRNKINHADNYRDIEKIKQILSEITGKLKNAILKQQKKMK